MTELHTNQLRYHRRFPSRLFWVLRLRDSQRPEDGWYCRDLQSQQRVTLSEDALHRDTRPHWVQMDLLLEQSIVEHVEQTRHGQVWLTLRRVGTSSTTRRKIQGVAHLEEPKALRGGGL